MLPKQYKSNELISILESLLTKRANGILKLKTKVDYWPQSRYCYLVLCNGTITFAGSKLPNNEQLAKILGKKLNPNGINAALLVASKQMGASESHQKFVDLLVSLKVFTWEEVQKWILEQLIQQLEIFEAHPGQTSWHSNNNFDLFDGKEQKDLDWGAINQKLQERQRRWLNLGSIIPESDGIPFASPKQLEKISDVKVKKHLAASANGQNTLLDIAEKMGKDPLQVAKIYFGWVKSGWVSFEKANEKAKTLPYVLSVDDSPIIQTMIKRSLKSTCNVLLADNHIKAMEMLNQHPIKMVLLDLTMPDMDGLEFCQMLREIPKFKELPIVMVTARDGLVDRAKGRFAGTNKYLTKPFKPEELREVVDQFISS